MNLLKTLKRLHQRALDWCDNIETVSIGDLHTQYVSPQSCEIFNDGELKFIERGQSDHRILIRTPTGFSPIKQTFKTVQYSKWILTLEDGRILECADNHIVIDSNNMQRFVKNLTQNDLILTEDGLARVASVVDTGEMVNMYDVEIDDDQHLYYSNGIVSHNTETSCSFLLWAAIFKPDQTILVASNKSTNAMEIIRKIQFAYEELPDWLKPGVDDANWNKHTCAWDNKSRIVSTTTSADSGRGMSISLLYCDELAFVKNFVAAAFWDSIFPTISTGGSVILSSTPNGDTGLFAEMWRGANAGTNPFSDGVTYVPWDAPPGRDEKFKQQMIATLGERKWLQEFECVTGDTEVTILDTLYNTTYSMSIENLYTYCSTLGRQEPSRHKILTENGFKNFLTVAEKTTESILELSFSDGSSLSCTEDHLLLTNTGFKPAIDLDANDVVLPGEKRILETRLAIGPVKVYDAVNVEDGNHYLTNDVTSHNCQFLTEDLTLIDSTLLVPHEKRIRDSIENNTNIAFEIGDFKFFKKIDPSKKYLVGVDPSTGSGKDFTVMQVFEFPTMEQVCEYRTNTLSHTIAYLKLKNLLAFLNKFTEEVYFTVERNGVGAGILALYENDQGEVHGNLVSEEGKDRLGFYTSDKSKNKACLFIKECFARGTITINSLILLNEFKSFTRYAGSYAAAPGATDDCIMGLVQIAYIIHEMSSYDDDAYVATYTVDEEMERNNAWNMEAHQQYSSTDDDYDAGVMILA